MASTKSGKAKAEVITKDEGGVKGSSSKPSGNGINRDIRTLTTTDLTTLHEVAFELSTKGVKGSSKSASSQRDNAARIAKGDF